MYISLYELCFLYNNKKQLVLCLKTNKNLIFVVIAFSVNLNEDVLEVEGIKPVVQDLKFFVVTLHCLTIVK